MASESTELVIAGLIEDVEAGLNKLLMLASAGSGSGNGGGNGSGKSGRNRRDPRIQEAFVRFSRLLTGKGFTEYGSEPYDGDQLTEKYKHATTAAWNGKPEAKGAVKAITKEEIEDGVDDYDKRKATLAIRREAQQAIDSQIKAQYLTDQSAADGSDEVDGGDNEPSADDVVNQALHGAPMKTRPSVVRGDYVSVFSTTGQPTRRNIARSALSSEPDIDDYHTYQCNTLTELDDDVQSDAQVKAKFENAHVRRQQVLRDRQDRQARAVASGNKPSHIRIVDDSDEEEVEDNSSSSGKKQRAAASVNDMDASDLALKRLRSRK
jgi:hypothetical protein